MTLKFPVRTLLLLALCLASCNRQAQPLPQEQSVLQLQAPASTQVSKTWIDAAAAGATAPVYWSAGDRITVNGVTSSPLELAPGEKVASASFYLRNITAPFKVVYPHSAYAGADEGSLLLDIPATQAWKDGSFAEGSALLYGYSASEDAPVQMQNLCGAIAFTLRDPSGIKVKTLSITSRTEGKPLAGRFSLTPAESLLLTPAGNNSARIDMQLPDGGLAIMPEGTSFFFTLPAGAYPDGFVIRLEDENKHILRCWWLRPSQGAEAGVTVDAGKLVVFQVQDYDPDAREICSAEDWEEFAAAYNAGGDGWKAEWLGKDGTVKVGADFTATSLTRLTTLTDILDGCGYTVTITAGTTPLVKTLTGTIRNLTIAGANIPSDSSTDGATIFVTNLNGGTIENCCNKATITLANHARATIAGPFVRTFTAGRVEGCVNEADFLLGINIEAANRYLLSGGIVGLVKDLTDNAVIKDCVNKGKITVMAVTTATAAKTPLQASYGGIVGSIIGGSADKYLLIDGCVNEGDISADFSPVPTNTTIAVSAVGGIVGTAMQYYGGLTFKWYSNSTTQATNQEGVYFQMKNCTSKGNVHNGLCSKLAHGDPNADFAGGLVGIANGLKDSPVIIENCVVEGINVEAIPNSYYQRSGFCMVSGGLAGFGGHVHLKDCTVRGAKVGSIKRQSYAVAGGIGMAPFNFKMEGCKIYADLYQIRCMISGTPCTDGHYALGFVLSTKKGPEGSATGQGGFRNSLVNPEGSSVTGCSFGGSITTNPTLVEYGAQSGFSTVQTTPFTASTFTANIPCGTFATDYKNRGIVNMVTISGNSYWNGQD